MAQSLATSPSGPLQTLDAEWPCTRAHQPYRWHCVGMLDSQAHANSISKQPIAEALIQDVSVQRFGEPAGIAAVLPFLSVPVAACANNATGSAQLAPRGAELPIRYCTWTHTRH